MTPARVSIFFLLFLAGYLLPARLAAQTNTTASQPSAPDQKAEAIVNRAIEVLGGGAYSKVQTVVGRGFFTSFQDGLSQIPARFLDYISYPNRERTEFTGGGIRVVQTNSGDTGWLYDGATRTFSDMKAGRLRLQAKYAHHVGISCMVGGKEGQRQVCGRREAGLARRTRRFVYHPDGFWIEYEFAAKEGLPAKVIYKTTKKKPDSDEMKKRPRGSSGETDYDCGVTATWVIDHFIMARKPAVLVMSQSITTTLPTSSSLSRQK